MNGVGHTGSDHPTDYPPSNIALNFQLVVRDDDGKVTLNLIGTRFGLLGELYSEYPRMKFLNKVDDPVWLFYTDSHKAAIGPRGE